MFPAFLKLSNNGLQNCHQFFRVLIIISLSWTIQTPNHGHTAGYHSPEECLAYSGDAHLNCLYAYIEIQNNTIIKLEETLNTQKRTTHRLQDQVDLHASHAQRLQKQNDTYHRERQEYRYPRLRSYARFSYFFGRPHYYQRLFGPRFGLHFRPYYSGW